MVSPRALSASSTSLRSVVAWPIRSPCPRTASATAVSTAFSFSGSIMLSRSTTFSKTVLISVLTFFECSTAPADSRARLGFCGITRSTNLAPNAVVALICASTLAGMYRIWSGSISSLRLAPFWAHSIRPIWATRPTCTPRIMTLAPESITSPERSAASVTGTVDRKLPVKDTAVTRTATPITANRISVHHASCKRCRPGPRLMSLGRQVKVGRLAVDGQRHDKDCDRRDDHRGTHGPADRLANPGRPPCAA